jgi:hypothetical protein
MSWMSHSCHWILSWMSHSCHWILSGMSHSCQWIHSFIQLTKIQHFGHYIKINYVDEFKYLK